MMKSMPLMPMPMRPRLPQPQSGSMLFTLPPTANPTISCELADVTCDDTCGHDHNHNHNQHSHDQPKPVVDNGTGTGTSAGTSINPSNNKKSAKKEPPPASLPSRLGPLMTPPPLVSPLAHLNAPSSSGDCESTPFKLTDVHSMDHDHGAFLSSLGMFDFDEDDEDAKGGHGGDQGHQKHHAGMLDHIHHNAHAQDFLSTVSNSSLPGQTDHTSSALLRQYQHQQRGGSTDISANANANSTHTILHQTCLLFPNDVTVVRTAMLGYPQAVLEHSPVSMNDFTLPLHIALSKSATFPVVQMLVNAGPSVLLEKDGPNGLTPLSLALTKNASNQVLGLLLHTQPQAAAIMCGPHRDLPMHIVCRQAPANPQQMEVMEALIPVNMAALHQVNGQGLTPIDMVMIQLQQLQRRQQLSPCTTATDHGSSMAQQNLLRVLSSLKHAAANMASPLQPNTRSVGSNNHNSGGSGGQYKRRKLSLR